MVNAIPTQGLLSVLSYAQTLYQLPISLFGMSVAAAELPEISAAGGDVGGGERDSARAVELRRRLGDAMRRAQYFVLPSAVALAFFGDVIVGLIWRGGLFDQTLVTATWVVLIGFSLGVIPATGGRIVATSFFAMRDTRTPLAFALARISVGAFLSATFLFVLPNLLNPQFISDYPLWRAAGLSLGGSLGFWLEFGLLYSAFESRVGPPEGRPGYYLRLFISVALAAAAGTALRLALAQNGGWSSQVAIVLGFGLTYLWLTVLFRVSQLGVLARLFRRG
jgi:putative peptidoglycan lipid II flippase